MNTEEITLYIDENGDDSNSGTRDDPLWSVAMALNRVRKRAYKAACFVISGSVTEVAAQKAMIDITGDGLPIILLRGESAERPGILNAKGLEKRVIYVADDNTLCIEGHIAIRGGVTQGLGGAGIAVEGATLIMKGGEISDNDARFGMGGGVYVGRDGKFVMLGGAITRNHTKLHGGGVFPDDGGKFTLFDGTISGNTAFVSGAGVFVGLDSEFKMLGGCIEKNMAGGQDGMMLAGMSIPCGQGGGVYVCQNALFEMEDGKIIKNRAIAAGRNDHAGSGGGVFVEKGGVCCIAQGSLAQNGAMNWGGGLYSQGHFTVTAECIIENNVARLGGGGIYITQEWGICEMKGGFLLNNYTGGKGGAVHVTENATFILEHGFITRNHAGELGHAFLINGKAAINGGLIFNNKYLPENEFYQHPEPEAPEPEAPDVELPEADEDVPALVLEEGGKLIIRGGEIEGKIALKSKTQLVDLREQKTVNRQEE
ncbi:MAG: hypothetical protein LBU28_08235 [Spirochaetaceae bacterium]|jgi:hypothetical protein|nr:hypothetical protein [Spirochaetaceae bacterium]